MYSLRYPQKWVGATRRKQAPSSTHMAAGCACPQVRICQLEARVKYLATQLKAWGLTWGKPCIARWKWGCQCLPWALAVKYIGCQKQLATLCHSMFGQWGAGAGESSEQTIAKGQAMTPGTAMELSFALLLLCFHTTFIAVQSSYSTTSEGSIGRLVVLLQVWTKRSQWGIGVSFLSFLSVSYHQEREELDVAGASDVTTWTYYDDIWWHMMTMSSLFLYLFICLFVCRSIYCNLIRSIQSNPNLIKPYPTPSCLSIY